MSGLVLSDENPIARKSHGCDDCWRVIIAAGESYRRVSAVDGREFFTHKSCVHCQEVMAWICRTDPEFVRYCDDGIDILEYLAEYGFTELAAMMRAHWAGVAADSIPFPAEVSS